MNTVKIGLLFTLFLAVSACSENSSSASSETVSSGTDGMPVYRVVRDFVYPPYLLMPQGKTNQGLEIDILEAIGKRQGFRLEYVHEPWEKLFKDLSERDISITLGGTSIEDVEQEVSTPARPYIVSMDCLAAANEADLDNWQQKNITTLNSGDWAEDLSEEYGISNKKIKLVDTHYQVLSGILQKNTEIGVGDCVSLRYNADSETFAKHSFAIKELPDSEEDDSTRIVFSVRKDQTELLAKINAGLADLEKSGELEAIKKRWGQ